MKKIILISLAFMFVFCSCGGYEKGTDDYKKEESATASDARKSSDEYTKELNEKLKKIQDLIDENYLDYQDKNIDPEDAYQSALVGYVAALGDKYSAYYPPQKSQEYTQAIEGSFVGIGVYAVFNEEEKRVVIAGVMDNGPAKEAGLSEGDIIMKIDGKDMAGVSLDDVVALMKGVEGTRVKVSVKRDGEEHEYELIRRKIETPTVAYELFEEKVGYVAVSAFDTVTVKQFSEAIDNLTEQGMIGLIIDLRNNGGGNLYSVTELSDKLIDKDKIVLYTIDSKGKREDSLTKRDDKIDVPVAVLVNENTASAAEVFAGCLRVHLNAKLVGSTTFGKGIMQQVFPLGDGSSVKLTMAKWYLPDDSNIQDVGLVPDIEVTQSADSDKDDVLESAVSYLTEAQ